MSSTTLQRLAAALRDLPAQQAEAARYVIGHPFDAATLPMRGLARQAGQAPVTFTRLARSIGLAGWEELRGSLVEDTRDDLALAHRGPFSSRALPEGSGEALAGAMLEADSRALAELDPRGLVAAAGMLEAAPRVLIAGFRSCYAPALLLHYLYRLFRPEVQLLTGVGGALDVDLGDLGPNDALVLFGFEPYSRDGLLCARAAADAGARVVAIVDTPSAPVAEGAAAILAFGTASPGFFPSLTACSALVLGLAATLYQRAGDAGRAQLRRTEARIAAHTSYLRLESGSE